MTAKMDQTGEGRSRKANFSEIGTRLLIPVALIAAGGFTYKLLSVEPEEAKKPPVKERVIKTTVQEVPLQDYRTVVTTRGIVRPHNEVELTAEVSGKVTEIPVRFEDGAYFSKGDVLVALDDADYRTALVSAEAQLARSKAAYAQEKARADQAQLNWDSLGYDEDPNELVLRLPQLREAEANVKASEAELERAQRDLERTRVRAPFDGRVRMRTVGLGQSIGPGTTLGTIFSIDFAEVRLPISSYKLRFLNLPEEIEDTPVHVELRDALNEDPESIWHGEIVRTEGTLDESSLELFAIARVADPFGRESGHPPLRVGQPVIGAVQGRLLEQVYVIPREAIRQVDRIFLVNKSALTLDRQIISPVWSHEDHVVIRAPGMFDNSYIATSQLSYTPDEAKVEIIGAGATEAVAGKKPQEGEATPTSSNSASTSSTGSTTTANAQKTT